MCQILWQHWLSPSQNLVTTDVSGLYLNMIMNDWNSCIFLLLLKIWISRPLPKYHTRICLSIDRIGPSWTLIQISFLQRWLLSFIFRVVITTLCSSAFWQWNYNLICHNTVPRNQLLTNMPIVWKAALHKMTSELAYYKINLILNFVSMIIVLKFQTDWSNRP